VYAHDGSAMGAAFKHVAKDILNAYFGHATAMPRNMQWKIASFLLRKIMSLTNNIYLVLV